jgi:hypothetical protein
VAREDGGIHDKDVVGPVHLGVQVHDRRAASPPVVGANLSRTCCQKPLGSLPRVTELGKESYQSSGWRSGAQGWPVSVMPV